MFGSTPQSALHHPGARTPVSAADDANQNHSTSHPSSPLQLCTTGPWLPSPAFFLSLAPKPPKGRKLNGRLAGAVTAHGVAPVRRHQPALDVIQHLTAAAKPGAGGAACEADGGQVLVGQAAGAVVASQW